MFRKTSSCRENLRDSNTLTVCRFNFQLDPDFKEQNFAVHLFRFTLKFSCVRSKDGGAMRDRTADLLRAKQALSQLSYSPIVCNLFKFDVSRKFERLEHTLTVCRFNFQLDPDF